MCGSVTYIAGKTTMAATEKIIEMVTLLEETASKPVTTLEEKQQLIEELSCQIQAIKQMVLPDDAPRPMLQQNNDVIYKFLEDDPMKKWKLCACDQLECSNCQAEKEAEVSATAWFDSPVSIPDFPPLELVRISEVVGLDENGRCPCGSLLFCDEMRQVAVDVDHFYHQSRNTNRYIIWLHPKLCCAFDTTEKDSHQSWRGLVALQFAAKMISSGQKNLITPHLQLMCFLKPEVYEIISHSLSESRKLYKANCPPEHCECLGIEKIVFLSSELGVHLKEEIELQDSMADVLLTYLLNLKSNEILLLIRMDNYNVWSAYARDDNVVIYDSQEYRRPTESGEQKHYGGVLYYMWKKDVCITNTLAYIWYISGTFIGACKLGLIELDQPED